SACLDLAITCRRAPRQVQSVRHRGGHATAVHCRNTARRTNRLGLHRDYDKAPGEKAPRTHTAMISASLPDTSLSISAIVLSVSFWTSSCERRSSSSVMALSLSGFVVCALASRRKLRTASLDSSAALLITAAR